MNTTLSSVASLSGQSDYATKANSSFGALETALHSVETLKKEIDKVCIN